MYTKLEHQCEHLVDTFVDSEVVSWTELLNFLLALLGYCFLSTVAVARNLQFYSQLNNPHQDYLLPTSAPMLPSDLLRSMDILDFKHWKVQVCMHKELSHPSFARFPKIPVLHFLLRCKSMFAVDYIIFHISGAVESCLFWLWLYYLVCNKLDRKGSQYLANSDWPQRERNY